MRWNKWKKKKTLEIDLKWAKEITKNQQNCAIDRKMSVLSFVSMHSIILYTLDHKAINNTWWKASTQFVIVASKTNISSGVEHDDSGIEHEREKQTTMHIPIIKTMRRIVFIDVC